MKPKSSRTGDFFDERRGRKVDQRSLLLLLENRMVEIDGKRHFKTLVRQKSGFFITIGHTNAALDANEFLGRLLLQKCPQTESKRQMGWRYHP